MAPIKIIIDTDPGVDDILAILLLLASPEVQIEAITICFGNTTVDKAHANILKLYQLIHKHIEAHPEDTKRFINFPTHSGVKPIYAKGANGPLKGSLNLAEYFHGQDGMSDIASTHAEYDVQPTLWGRENPFLNIVDKPAHQVILDVLTQEPEDTVTLIALGPLTNVSLALTNDPNTFARVHRVVSMGGAINVPGNTSPTSEFNIFADPYAAQHVYDEAERNSFKFVLVPLDITSLHIIPFNRMIGTVNAPPNSIPDTTVSIEASKDIPNFLEALLGRPRKTLHDLGLPDAMEMHDPLAAWYAICAALPSNPGLGWLVYKKKFAIERTGEHTRGMCVVDRRGTNEGTGTTRSIDGIVLEGTGPIDVHPGVDVLLQGPDPALFTEIMMKRVFWYSS